MPFTQRPRSGRPWQTNRREGHHIVRKAHVKPTASSAAIQAQVEPSLGALVSSRTIRRRLAEGQFGSRCPTIDASVWNGAVHEDNGLQWNATRSSLATHARALESRFNPSSDDKRVRVWRPRGECLNPVFALQRHIAPTAGVMVWGAIAYNTRSSLVLIRGTIRAQRYVHGILQPHVLPLMQRLPGAIFQQDNARLHKARVS
ncbi:transposable element Tcb2 transposase [Trichonephila clavipes]|nr:transposable element Tcb2 transposase [Trichonephila clavipes]